MSDSRIRCGNGHIHPNVQAVRACYAAPVTRPTAPTATPAVRPRVVHTSAMPTDAQRAHIARMGGTLHPDATRLEASHLIDTLIATRKQRQEHNMVSPVHQSRLGLPVKMLFDLREGRYAVSPEGTNRLDFIRLHVPVPPKKPSRVIRRNIGCLVIQSQHSDDLIDRAVVQPDGQVRILSNTYSSERLTEILMTIMADQRGAAIRYGLEKGHCCRCGKQLTDTHSRWYGIGPECVKHWPEIIDEVDQSERGPFRIEMVMA